MKPFIRVKRIGGGEYLYEVTPYYDPVEKKIRQRSRYLGKNVGGVPVRVRSCGVMRVYSCGEFLPLLEIAGRGLREELCRWAGDTRRGDVLLVLLFNRLTRQLPHRLVGRWYRGTVLRLLFGELPLQEEHLRSMEEAHRELLLSSAGALEREVERRASAAGCSGAEALLELERLKLLELEGGGFRLTEPSEGQWRLLSAMLQTAEPERAAYRLLATSR
ncbi:MAG: hypothetical protein GXO66_01835 [Euryarchaeota archaeon]|nr:hypothetical protein [Euryarchaeota archaeon]